MFVVSQVIESRLFSIDAAGVVVAPKIIGAVSGVGVAVVLVPVYGVVGAAMANAAAQLAQLIAMIRAFRMARGERGYVHRS